MDLAIVLWFQSLESWFMNVFFGAFYYLLNPLVTMFVPIILYYLVDKRLAYRTGIFYGVTSFFNGTLKEIFNRARPFETYPDKVKTLIESKASSQSMPSGHAMGSIGLFYPAVKLFGYRERGQAKRIWVFALAVFCIMMIGFSRLYMGAHYLTDIMAGWGFGLIIAVGIDFATYKLGDKFYLFGLFLIPLMLLFIIIFPDADSSGVGMAFTSAMLIGGFLDQKFIKLDTKVAIWKRILMIFIAIQGAFLGLLLVSKLFEAGLGYAITDIKTEMAKTLTHLDAAAVVRRIKSVTALAYFLMFFAANAFAFIIAPLLYKFVPPFVKGLFKKDDDKTKSTEVKENGEN